MFFINRNWKTMVLLCDKFSILVYQNGWWVSFVTDNWIWMKCNLKKVTCRLTFFKFSHFHFQSRLEGIMICSSFKNWLASMAGVNRDGGGGTKKKRRRREGAPAIRTGQFALPPPISLYMYIIELRQLSIQLYVHQSETSTRFYTHG